MKKKFDLKTSVKNLGHEFKTYWKMPAPGKYVPYREYLQIFFGVSANYSMRTPINMLSFAVSCYLIMYHYNIDYLTFSVIGLLGAPLGYLWSFLSWIIADNLGFFPKKTERKFFIVYGVSIAVGLVFLIFNLSPLIPEGSKLAHTINNLSGINTKTIFKILGVQLFCNAFGGIRNIFWRKKLVPKYGRYKYTLYGSVWQKAILFILIGWLPIYKIGDMAERVWIIYLLLTLFGLYDCGNYLESCASYISPNPQERLMVRTWPVQLGHGFNSILEFVVPVIIAAFPNKFADINIYRFLLPGLFIMSAILTMIFAPKFKERIPQPPIEKKVQIGFWDGIFGVMRNKYNWIDTVSSLIDTLGNGMLDFTVILLLYTLRADGIIYSIIITALSIFGSAPYFISPYFIKRFSYKQIRVFGQLSKGVISGLYVVVLFCCGNNYILMSSMLIVLKMFFNLFIAVPDVATADMSCRLLDYQMYLSGERLENFKGIFGIIISPITTLVGLIIPILLLRSGYNSNWDVLFIDSARFGIISIPIIIDTVGYFLMAIPYLFWDYDDKKHAMVIEELKRRARITGGEDFDAEAEKLRERENAPAVATTEATE